MCAKIAALYVHGRIVTGTHHGDAFSKLTIEEKTQIICSGFLDEEHHKFIGEDKEIFVKEIVLIRHANVDDSEDPSVTDQGRSQIKRAANFLNDHMDLSDFQGFNSPIKRCQQTADEFSKELNVFFKPETSLIESASPRMLLAFLNNLPCKSLLITHCDIISSLVYLTTEKCVKEIKYCSPLIVVNNTVTSI